MTETLIESTVRALQAGGVSEEAIAALLGGLVFTTPLPTPALPDEEPPVQVLIPMSWPEANAAPAFADLGGPLGTLLASGAVSDELIALFLGGLIPSAAPTPALPDEEPPVQVLIPMSWPEANAAPAFADLGGPLGTLLASGAVSDELIGLFLSGLAFTTSSPPELTGEVAFPFAPLALDTLVLPAPAVPDELAEAVLELQVALEANPAALFTAFAALRGVIPQANDLLNILIDLMIAIKLDSISINMTASIDLIITDLNHLKS